MNRLASLAAAVVLATAAFVPACGGEAPVETGDEQNVTDGERGRFEILVGEDEQFYFRLVANNREKVLRSEGYTTRQAAEKGIASAKKNGTTADAYRVQAAQDGQFFFNLVARNGEILGTSETYTTKSGAERGAETVRKILASFETRPEPKLFCALKRLPVAPQGAGLDEVEITHLGEDDYASSEGLEAFDGAYNFDVGRSGDEISVTFYEGKHVQDETGQIGCEVPAELTRGTVFCQEPIEIDANLGTDAEEENVVHAFDFACRVD